MASNTDCSLDDYKQSLDTFVMLEQIQEKNVVSSAVAYEDARRTPASTEVGRKWNEYQDQRTKKMMISNAVNNTVVKIGDVKLKLGMNIDISDNTDEEDNDENETDNHYEQQNGHPVEKRTDRPGEERIDNPNEQQNDHPVEKRTDCPGEERIDNPTEQQIDHPDKEQT